MEFLVSCEVRVPDHLPQERIDALRAAEAARAAELAAAGVLVRLWRVPGRWANRGLWCAADADELHTAIDSLPMRRWLDVRVEALATHPSDPARRG